MLSFYLGTTKSIFHSPFDLGKKRFRFPKKTLEQKYMDSLGDKERFVMEQIGGKEPFPMTNCQFAS